MKHLHKFVYILVLASLLALAAGAIVVESNEDRTLDKLDENDTCDLREAIANANGNNQAYLDGAAGDGVDTITFDNDYTITLFDQLPIIESEIVISGNGVNNTIIQAAAAPDIATYRIFHLNPLGNLTLQDLTVQNGRCIGACEDSATAGGGIYVNDGSLRLINAAVLNNRVAGVVGQGGGIYGSGVLDIQSSLVYGNHAEQSGGGINFGGDVDIRNSAVAGNSSNFGAGGLYLNSFAVTNITNSTIAGNSSVGNPGGIYNNGTLTLTNSTVADNDGNDLFGSGISTVDGVTTLKNTIVALNDDAADCSVGGSGVVNADSFNIDTDGTCGNATQKTGIELNFNTLDFYGGTTLTLALRKGSHAIDAGDPAVCAAAPVNNLDQRGRPRPVDGDNIAGAICDVGAFELGPTFADVPLNHWTWQFVESIYYAGITGGCSNNPLNYCPTQPVTRAQMAVFLLKGMYGSGYVPPAATGAVFNDIPVNHPFAKWIEQLDAEGITGGCGGGKYCPSASVTHEQMAVFLLVAEHGTGYTPPAATGVFTDVPTTNGFAPWIEALAAEGITGGCGGGKFCPKTTVNREQMAVFLVAAFNLP
jgi:hypothetical protein